MFLGKPSSGNNLVSGLHFDKALALIDKANSEDPNKVFINGKFQSKELLYSQRMTSCLKHFAKDAPDHLQLAARCQHICRWVIPREQYELGRDGYRRWRTDLGRYHAETTGEILREVGYEEDFISRVQALVRKEHLKKDLEVQILEDVICLVFLEYYFSEFAAKHNEEKVIDILRKTWRKMSNRGRDVALTINLDPALRALVEKALSGTS